MGLAFTDQLGWFRGGNVGINFIDGCLGNKHLLVTPLDVQGPAHLAAMKAAAQQPQPQRRSCEHMILKIDVQ